MITNNTNFNNSKPPKYYINGHRVRSMYYENNLIFHHVPCTEIRLNAHEIILTMAGKFTLKPVIVPADCNEDVVWSSSNNSIAKVANGVITPVALGTCNISIKCGSITASCKVSVKEETVKLYNQGVINNDTEFGKLVFPNHASFVFQSKQIFIEIPGARSNYGATWFSWANNVEISEYDYLDIHTTNPNDHSSVIGITRNNKSQQSGYQLGLTTDIDGSSFVSDRTVTTLLQGNKKHRLDMDLIGGDNGYLGLYFKRLESGDTVDEHILIDYIYVTRKSSYVVGSGEDLSQDATIPCTALNLTQDELVLSYKGQPVTYNLNNLLSITPSNSDEVKIWAMIEHDDTITLSNNGIITANGAGHGHVQVIAGNCFDNIRIKSIIECTSISLDKTSLSFTSYNATQKLNATIAPSNTTDTITWKSSNTSVASVSANGTVTSVGEGSCTITATCGSKSATCSVTIDAVRPCTSISLSKSSYTLDLSGTDSVTFTATVAPSNTTDNITWSSNKTSVATVSATSNGAKGTIFAKSPGTATITATCGSKSASITITVEASCTGISVSPSTYTINVGDFIAFGSEIFVSRTPSNCTDNITYHSGNVDIVDPSIAAEGVYRGYSAGTTTLTATCGGKSASCTVTVKEALPTIVLSSTSSYMAVGEKHTFYADLSPSNTSYDMNTLQINSSKSSLTFTYTVISQTRVAVTVTMVSAEAGAINFILPTNSGNVTARFEAYVRV